MISLKRKFPFERCYIDLNTKNCSTALRIKPKFKKDKIILCCNTFLAGWSTEMRYGPFPYQRDSDFLLVITVESDHYKVDLNGEHVFNYEHRIAKNKICDLEIKGRIQCQSVKYEKNSS